MSFTPNTHILQRVVNIEESNGVISTVTGRFLAKKTGEREDIALALETFMTASGASTALTIFKAEGNTGVRRYESSDDETSDMDKKTRRSERLKNKKKKDTAKESDPPSSNECKKGKDASPTSKSPNVIISDEESGAKSPNTYESNDEGNGTDVLSSEDEVGEKKDASQEPQTNLYEEDFTVNTDCGTIYELMRDYKKVCGKDHEWVDKQLRRLNIEPPKPTGTDIIDKVELEGILVPPDDEDMERGAEWKADMIMYNMKDLTTKGIEGITRCKVFDVDFSGGSSLASIKFKIKGIYNAIRAIINVARSGLPVDLFFKQALDNYDKLRSIFINNTPPKIKNYALWKESLKNELGIYGTVVDVMILRRTVTVTFARPREAFIFEKKTFHLSIAGFDVTASRTPCTVLRTPSDVVIEGFYNDDAEETIEAIAAGGDPICSLTIVCRKDRGALVATFANYRRAVEFVKQRKMTLVRGNSNLSIDVNIDWCRDSNTRKAKKEEVDSTPGDAAAVLAKLTALDNKLREDKKAGVAEFKRIEKQREKTEFMRAQERKDDQVRNWHMIAESQNRVLSVVGNTLASIADKQAVIDCITDELTDCRGERQLINFQLMLGGSEDPSKAQLFESLTARKSELDGKISELQGKRNEIVARKIELPVLPPPVMVPLALPATNKESGVKKRPAITYVTPNRDVVDQFNDILKDKSNNRAEASELAWNTIMEDVTRKNVMQMGDLWTFMLPIGVAEKELIISKYQAFCTVFNGTTEATTANNIVEQLERAVAKEREGLDKKRKK